MKNTSKSVKPIKKAVKPSKKRTQPKREDIMRNLGGLLIIFLIAGGMFVGYRTIAQHKSLLPQKDSTASITEVAADQKAAADKIFRNYLVKLASTPVLSVESTYAEPASDTKMTGQTIYNAAAKKATQTLEMQCSTRISSGGEGVTLNASAQTDNATTYVRLNKVTGTYAAANGQAVNAATRYASVLGKWYQSDPDASMQAQIDNGVFVLDSGVMAPGSDPQKVADALINSKALEQSQNKAENGDYTYSVTMRKANYTRAMKQAFPAFSGSDKVIDALFGGADVTEMTNTVVVRQDGTLVSQETLPNDPCQVLVNALGGVNDTSATFAIITENSTAKQPGSITVAPITGARPQVELQRAITR